MPDLCLGTVQFGMKYGVNNQIGRQPAWEESFEMLDYALDHGIDTIDTASAYGEAEMILGSYFKRRRNSNKIRVISKLSPNIIGEGVPVKKTVIEECRQSLQKLGLAQLDGYLLHTPEYVYRADILEALCQLKKEGYVRNIGVSIYDLKEGFAAIDSGVMDYIQLPYSLFDQRGMQESFIPKAKKAGIKIFTRSAFLQGLFMMERTNIPDHLQKAVPYLDIVQRILQEFNVDLVSAILQFVKKEKDIDYLVFGVETIRQLEEDILKAGQDNIPDECIRQLKEQINNVSQSIIFPSLWSNGRKA